MDPVLSRDLLRLKLDESLSAALPALTRRDVEVPSIPGKVFAVIGVRRGGKTSFLQRRIAERIEAGASPASQLLLSLEDERLVGMTALDLGWIIDEFRARATAAGVRGPLSMYIDEVQTVPGWETVVRRLNDTREIEVFVSGSSARLLSREVATSLRGRAMEILIHPYSFREALRHVGEEPTSAWDSIVKTKRGALTSRLREYLSVGGFPEVQGVGARDRFALLKSYVDVMLLRDVIDRHAISNTTALRWLQRHLLSTPAGTFTVKKLYDALRSQGLPVAKDTLYQYLDHLQDAFMVRTTAMHSTSERQRMANPRKVYPIDPGLIALYERAGRENYGRALETAVLLELERRGWSVDWMRVGKDREVDFIAERTGEPPLLIQVALETGADATLEREIGALADAVGERRRSRALLLTLDATPPTHELPQGIEWMHAAEWMLERE